MIRLQQVAYLVLTAVAVLSSVIAIGQDRSSSRRSSDGLPETQGSVRQLSEEICSPNLSVPNRSRTARLLLADLTASELQEFAHSQRLLSLFALWELNRRVLEAKMIESGDDSVKLSSEFWDVFLDATQKLYLTRIPDRWEHLARSMQFGSNGTFDLTPGFLLDRADDKGDVRAELDADKSILVVTSGEREVKVRGANDLWLIDYIAATDHLEQLIVLIPTLPELSLLVGSVSPGDTGDAADFFTIDTNWVHPRVGLLECFPMSTNDGKLVVFYATYQQIGVVEIGLKTGESHNHFCSSTRFLLTR